MKKIVFIILTTAFINSCSTAVVNVDYDREVNFVKYRSFDFYKDIQWESTNEIDQKRILNAIYNELTQKGFSKSESPDILIDIKSKSRTVKTNDATVGLGSGSYGRGVGVGVSIGIPINSKKKYKTFIIDLIDSKSNELVWQGIYENKVSDRFDNEKLIKEAFSDLFKKFPPKN